MSTWAMADPRRRYPANPLVDEESEAVLVVAVEDLVLLYGKFSLDLDRHLDLEMPCAA